MDSLKLHQLLNYYPAIGMVIGTLVLAIGIARGRPRPTLFALKLVFIVALLTVVVAFTGEFASWDSALYTGARGEALAQHRSMATTAFAVVIAAGAASLVALLRSHRHGANGRRAVLIAFALMIIASVLLVVVIFRGRYVKWAGVGPLLKPSAAAPAIPGATFGSARFTSQRRR